MAFKKVTGEVIGKLVEELAILSESDCSDWVTGLAKISWKEKEPNIEIRKYNKTFLSDPEKASRGFGKGISLDEDELNTLTEELVRLGYGDDKVLRKSLKSRVSE